MKLSYNWLKQFIKIKLTPEQLAEKLTLAGFEVEQIFRYPKIKGVKVGEIISIRKHPKAKKLKILKVAIGRGKIKQIVCGALNIEKGQKVPVALPGAEILGLDVDGKPGKELLIIQETKIRGVRSEGVLCAEDELGIGDDHSGIYILSPEVKIGEDINKVLDLDDVVFDLEITPNRGDCLSVLGLAREVVALTNSILDQGIASIGPIDIGPPRNDSLVVEVKEPKLCPKYTARVIKNVEIGESPQWLKNRLRAVGIKSINNIVDITNYVMMELGQPLHAFDLNMISGSKIQNPKSQIPNKSQILNPKFQTTNDTRIIVRRAKNGEKIITIDGKMRELDKEMLVIADSKKPIALAGIMGGKDTEVTEKTKDIILESAQFDPISVRKTARKLGLQTESSYRFERGVDWNMVEVALDRATELIFNFQKGKKLVKSKKNKIEISQKVVVQQQERYLRRVVKLPVEKVSEVLGVKISKQKIKDILEALGFRVAEFEATKLGSNEATKLIKKLIEEAKKLIGRPYKYGAKESEAPRRFDCSSLTQYLYKKIGIIIPRCSIDQAECGSEVTKLRSYEATKLRKVLKPGDLVFGKGEKPHYSANYPEGLGHVGIYLGRGKVVDADSKKKKVVEQTLEEFIKNKKWQRARRIVQLPITNYRPSTPLRIKFSIFIVTIPSWREDVSIPEDLIEEVGRIYDYNKLKPTALRGEAPTPKINKELAWENLIKDTLVAAGMTEVYNYSFYGDSLISTNDLRISTNKREYIEKHLQVVNPINPDQRFLRISLIPRLLETVEKNSKNFEEIKIFELGKVYLVNLHKWFDRLTTGSTTNITNDLPDERRMVAGIISQKSKVKSQKYLEENFYQIKGIVELLFDKLGIDENKITWQLISNFHSSTLPRTFSKSVGVSLRIKFPISKQISNFQFLISSFIHAARGAIILIGKEVIGIIGETSTGLGLFELDFQKLIKYAKERKEFQAISYYPAVKRDLAIVVDKNIPYANLAKIIKQVSPLIKEINLFDIFEDEKKIGKNKRSLAFHLKFQSFDRTLKKEEVDNIFQNILKSLRENFQAEIRSS